MAGLKRGYLAWWALVMSSAAFAAEPGAVLCPSANFVEFVTAFTANPDTQPAFVASPVMELSVVSTGSKPLVVQRQVATLAPRSLTELSADYIAKSGLSLQVQLPNYVFVRDHKGEVLKAFTFKFGDCWKLVRVEDWSLEKVLSEQQGELRAAPGARALKRGALYDKLTNESGYPADVQLYVSSLDSYLDGAAQGNDQAAYAAASVSLSGQAPRLDNSKILELLSQGSRTLAQASHALSGFYCDEGEYGDPRPCADPAKSLAALKRSAAQGSPYALNDLGSAFQRGTLGIQDSPRALACYLAAANMGQEDSRTNAEQLSTQGIQVDPAKPCLMPEPAEQAQVLGCPSKDFEGFLADFMESTASQKTFTRVPMKKLITVDAEPEPKQVSTLLDRSDLVFPLIPEAKARAMQGLTLEIVDQSDTSATVKLQKPDTGYQVIYRFSFDGCWGLDEVQDFSI
ncbi:sel1 repeat family protein [Pseudomonas sp. ANT_J12]|uniref:tetratricopeptide repeat protein n=1 Tax=Pseudomonas sp. ANT_J12 TaxID=2597351 RepID=UPI0011F3A7B2|nr:sel1 repeat family protein [Pseudomonas sp. ANT_J12]KAA0988566.1 sel1 repeat family protein [Pseudomonas sp. ANT_J12]